MPIRTRTSTSSGQSAAASARVAAAAASTACFARLLVGGERVCLPAGAVEREHQLGTQALAQRLLAHERRQLGDERRVPTEGEVRLDPILERDQAQLLEARDVSLRERLVAKVGERRTAPEVEGLAEPSRRGLGTPVRKRGASFLEEPLEPVEIELLRIDTEQVAAALGTESRAGVHELAQTRSDDLDGVRGGRGRRLSPQGRAELVTRHAAVRMKQKQGKRDTLAATAKRQRAFLSRDLERAEDPKLQPHRLRLTSRGYYSARAAARARAGSAVSAR